MAIARALVGEPAIVWADEPTGNLDSQTAGNVLELLSEVNRTGQTLVVITHDRSIGERGHRLVEVRDGVVVSGTSYPPAGDTTAPTVASDGHWAQRVTLG